MHFGGDHGMGGFPRLAAEWFKFGRLLDDLVMFVSGYPRFQNLNRMYRDREKPDPRDAVR